ncbi:MAG: PepSY domain-containing protein, partial [Gemmatimonadetes bacterium]|nr:PepSY domain-containing protein [Gemmatimonadota bacterium]
MRLHKGMVIVMLLGGAAACAKSGNEAGQEAPEQAAAPAGEAGSAAAVQLTVEDSSLIARATVTDEAARAAALASVPGGQIVAGELEEEGGSLIYSYDVKVEAQEGVQEVHVDATTGKV